MYLFCQPGAFFKDFSDPFQKRICFHFTFNCLKIIKNGFHFHFLLSLLRSMYDSRLTQLMVGLAGEVVKKVTVELI